MSAQRVLVVNAGSSTVKIRLLDADDRVELAVDLPADRGRPDPGALAATLRGLPARPDVVGHRIVHGGTMFTAPVLVTGDVAAELERLVALAPLHQPAGLAALRATGEALPDVAAVACFDTAFHATLPAAAATYAVPAGWREHGVRRYGFHGLAHEWGARRVAELLGRPVERIVVAHLGSGASLCAVRHGRSVDTTMGFTPTAGLVMGSRCGDLDPAVPLWLVVHCGMAATDVAGALDHGSGLLALAGDADMRSVLTAADRGCADATLAVDVWVHRARAGVAAMAAALGGLDALVFSGGIGEHQPRLRTRIAGGLGFLGLALDARRNAAADGDTDISADGAKVRTVVVAAREDRVIAAGARTALSQQGRDR